MTGIVCIWPFTIATIPDGWLLCDGDNGTPDMRGYVAIGARDGFDAGAVLGAATHVHPFDFESRNSIVTHTHDYGSWSFPPDSGSNNVTDIGGLMAPYDSHVHYFSGTSGVNSAAHSHQCVSNTAAADSKQLSREILFIMKE